MATATIGNQRDAVSTSDAELATVENIDDMREMYLDLMKRSVTNWIYADVEKVLDPVVPVKFWKRWVKSYLNRRGMELVNRPYTIDPALLLDGSSHPISGHTMIGFKRLDNIQACAEHVLKNNVPGDFIETGAWRGGACIFMRAILKAYRDATRCVWVADSFSGFPPPDVRYPQDADAKFHLPCGHRHDSEGDVYLHVSLERVQENFRRYGLLDGQVRFLKGWFHETLPNAPIEQLSLIRLDGDMYGSTMDALLSLYPKLSVGGFVIVDDYEMKRCQKAIHDFRASQGISDELVRIDKHSVYWVRTARAANSNGK